MRSVTVFDREEIELTAPNILLATGAHPMAIPGLVPDGVKVLTAPDVFQLREKPESALIVGAGAIGVQFASFFAAFGTKVTLVEVAAQVLPSVDAEVAKRLAYSFRKRGIGVHTAMKLVSCDLTGKKCRSELSDGASIETDLIILAAGFIGNVNCIGAEQEGIAIERGFFTVDDRFRTSLTGVCAIGDCIGAPMLAHAAAREGERAVDAMLGKETHRLDPRLVPIAIYSHPNIASVGLTEETARADGYDILIGNCPFKIIGKAVAMGETEGFVKVIIDKTTRKFLGAHIIGASADEILQEIVLAMTLGMTADNLLEAIHPHPTLTEAVYEATATALGRPVNL
jgi:dihydrolipoamide dehydrogenase